MSEELKAIILAFSGLFVMIFNGLLLVRIVMSYFASPENSFYAGLVNVTEPLLAPVRKIIPPLVPGLDLAPLATFFLLDGVDQLLRILLGS